MSEDAWKGWPAVDFVPSGIEQAVPRDRVNKALQDPGPGFHLWTMIAMYRLNDPSVVLDVEGQVHMDMESLMTLEGPGCYKCETMYTPEIAAVYCHGSM